MKKIIFSALLAGSVFFAKAQTTNNLVTEHDSTTKAKDRAAIKTMIMPAEDAANGDAPDWDALKQTITAKYDAVTADRCITKAKIYFYYAKDWPTFCDALVHYTDNWELASDYKLLNGNAEMILKNSNDMAQLKEAQHWAKMAMDGDASNANYKATYEAITDKLAGK